MKLPRLAPGLLLAASLALVEAAATPPAIVGHAAQPTDGRAAFTFNAAAYQGDLSALPAASARLIREKLPAVARRLEP